MSAVLAPIVASLPSIESADGAIQTEPFLRTCRLMLPVFDRLGSAFAFAKSDVSGNIERLGRQQDAHAALFDVCLAEIQAGTHASNSGCSKGLLWLKRFLEFAVTLLRSISDATQNTASMKTLANAAYERSLKPYHGWISSSAFAVVLAFPPSREVFEASLDGDHENMAEVAEGLAPVLEKIHRFLDENGLNDESKA
jgi:Ca2+:H+ antiporter